MMILIHVVRTRNVNQKVKILDEDYFLTSIVSNISDSVAKDSIYHYLETQLGLDISYSSKSITFEPFTEREYNVFGKIQPPYTATVRSVVYLKNTMPFQYNVSKHLATEFKFKNFQDDTNYKMKLYWFRFIELLIETLRLQSEESL